MLCAGMERNLHSIKRNYVVMVLCGVHNTVLDCMNALLVCVCNKVSVCHVGTQVTDDIGYQGYMFMA